MTGEAVILVGPLIALAGVLDAVTFLEPFS
jgi:hypothetical protein